MHKLDYVCTTFPKWIHRSTDVILNSIILNMWKVPSINYDRSTDVTKLTYRGPLGGGQPYYLSTTWVVHVNISNLVGLLLKPAMSTRWCWEVFFCLFSWFIAHKMFFSEIRVKNVSNEDSTQVHRSNKWDVEYCYNVVFDGKKKDFLVILLYLIFYDK